MSPLPGQEQLVWEGEEGEGEEEGEEAAQVWV
jgi:hypothetical protein